MTGYSSTFRPSRCVRIDARDYAFLGTSGSYAKACGLPSVAQRNDHLSELRLATSTRWSSTGAATPSRRRPPKHSPLEWRQRLQRVDARSFVVSIAVGQYQICRGCSVSTRFDPVLQERCGRPWRHSRSVVSTKPTPANFAASTPARVVSNAATRSGLRSRRAQAANVVSGAGLLSSPCPPSRGPRHVPRRAARGRRARGLRTCSCSARRRRAAVLPLERDSR